MVIGMRTSLQMCTYYTSSCVLKKALVTRGFWYSNNLVNINNAFILKSNSRFCTRIQLVLSKNLRRPIASMHISIPVEDTPNFCNKFFYI